jgi:glutamine amidotransferase
MIVGILDYGAGNLKNVCRAVEHLGFEYVLVSSAEDFACIDKLIIPGVGAFKVAMEQLNKFDLIDAIRNLSSNGTPIFGICLGMQLLFGRSHEFGVTEGLGLVKGEVELIPSLDGKGEKLKIPHIGWNELIVDNSDSRIVKNLNVGDAVYFVHSYRVTKYDQQDLVAHCNYADILIPSIIKRGNIFGCQFHPEKSGAVGLSLLNNFLSEIK